MTHDEYKKELAKFEAESPYKTDEDYNRAFGIDENKPAETLILKPKKEPKKIKEVFEAPKRKDTRTGRKKKPLTREQKDRINQRIREKRARENAQKEGYKKRTSLVGMTDEEKRAHKAQIKRECIARKRENGTLKKRVRTADEKAKQLQYYRDYYNLNKDNPEYKAKRIENQRKFRERLKNGTNK